MHQDWVDQITDDHPSVMHVIGGSRLSYGDDMGAFLCFMAVRLLAMHRVLRPTGSIYLHCDPTASHYLKELMDAIFGRKQFRNEIVWCYTSGGVSKRWWARKHDLLLFYSKSKRFNFNPQYRPYSEGTLQRGLTQYKKDLGGYSLRQEGAAENDWWVGIQPIVSPTSRERMGYPTQKPLPLYERIIKASSTEGDIICDPFSGCATTLIAAERLNRQWVGMDIWDNAKAVVLERLEREGLIGKGRQAHQGNLFTKDIHFTSAPPIRTDDGETAAPFLRVKERIREPEGQRMSRAEMYQFLLTQHGPKCQGCDRSFDDPRYLELDHNTPRADGGINHISNRILLCGPCNRLKSNTYTLSGLRRENKKRDYMR